MAILAYLLLGLTLCWDASPDADVAFYRVRLAERHITGWAACPNPGDPNAMCPTYSPFAWEIVETPALMVTSPCAEELGSFCVYTHPVAVDFAGNVSTQPMLVWPPPVLAACP